MKSFDSESLCGKWALVTGASGGIGSQIARELARAGANLILHTYRNRTAASKLAEEIDAIGPRAEIVECNLAESQKCNDFADAVWQIASLDILVNNAGVDVLTGEAEEWSFAKKLELLWKVDVRATIELSRTLGARMRERGSGDIINIGWDQAEHGMAGDSGEMFATIKGAVMSFTRSLAKSLAPQVRVNCVAPGWIQTKWGSTSSDYWQERARAESLVGRWGTPSDVAGAVRFLASPSASFVNGQILNVNGGWAGSASNH
ncbi:SDR family NAD(P)-dependent oxidoreductase [Bythopirellula polymerisocia]|uniref:3-oxoacyl-[acyl-carrier-protein] reductase FabG n=1 Tax=Bythopirellula polymerisocia TaxID=2528003 RepID=A0A5C6CGW8_9BACT|nr:SDR family oxidoreductase [Bythopirellula polymerisocia]TWU22814.1 3-oxoacyl-[acyl-carrier-protein] reductase FabG [Bythopirellula polymerisocia]